MGLLAMGLCILCVGIFTSKNDISPKKDIQTYRLAAKVTWTGPAGTRKIGLQHDGIPGSIAAGDHSFILAPEMPWPNVMVGQNVECVLELRNGQWVVSKVNPNKLVAVTDNRPLVPHNMPLVPDKEKTFAVYDVGLFLGISPDFKTYATGHFASTLDSYVVEIVDLKSREILASVNCGQGRSNSDSVAFGKAVIAVRKKTGYLSLFGDVKILLLKSGEVIQEIRNRQIRDMAFTADGRLLVTIASRAQQEERVKADAVGEKRSEIKPDGIMLPPPPPPPMAPLRDSLVIYDVQTKKLIADVDLGGKGDYFLAVTGKYAAVYEMESDRIIIVEAETGKLVKQFNAGSIRKRKAIGSRRMPFSISPEGELLACGVEKEVLLYNIAGNNVIHKWKGHFNTVCVTAFSPDGQVVASIAEDKTIRFWNVEQGQTVRIFNIPFNTWNRIFPRFENLSFFTKIIFSTDGNRIAVVNRRDHTTHIAIMELK